MELSEESRFWATFSIYSNYLTGQLLFLESRLIRKQKNISNILMQRETTIHRQQKIIDSLSNRLGICSVETNSLDTDCDLKSEISSGDTHDTDSAVVLEDGSDVDTAASTLRRKSFNDVARSISDVIQMPRRSNCYLRRPDILETVYSVEEDPDQNEPAKDPSQLYDVSEKRDKFKNRSDRITDDSAPVLQSPLFSQLADCYDKAKSETPTEDDKASKANQVNCFNRVMSNHRSVTKPKDVKYKRINKAKSRSLEELRGKLKIGSWTKNWG